MAEQTTNMEIFEDNALQVDVDLTAQSLLLAAANHDIPALKDLLKTAPATVQDPETGYTPLHAAIASCEEEESENIKQVNGNTDHANEASEERKKELNAAAESVRLLLQSGAIWNDLDSNNETPGCIARRLGLDEIYQLIVDAGVRAELLLSRLDEYQELSGEDEDEDEEEDPEASTGIEGEEAMEDITAPGASLMATAGFATEEDAPTSDPSTSNPAYLSSNLSFTTNSILDSATNGVMMSWEAPLMTRHADLLLPNAGLRVLNIGHGMGIIDTHFQTHSPSSHHIIEAHPSILEKLTQEGWSQKPGVVIHSGRWQDVLPNLVAEGVVFDAIYFDTFAEEYKALREFFSEWVVQLLDSEGKFGFFNGMGADREVCYDVYAKVPCPLILFYFD